MPYTPAVYRTSGGDQLTVASGGVLEMESGATLSLDGQAITTTGYVTGVYKEYVETNYTGGALTGGGLSVVGTSSGTATIYTIAPVSGVRKFIVCTFSTSTSLTTILTTGTWDGTNKNLIASTGLTNPQWLDAIAITTDRWGLISRSTDWSLTNT